MLNLNDVKRRLKDYPEPDEVSEIRDKIIKTFSNLEFQEGPHKYYVHNIDGTQYELPSVSGMIKQWEPEVDWEEITRRYAMKYNRTYEEVKREWHENNIISTNNGTSTHLYGEMYNYFFRGEVEKICDIIKPQYEDEYLIPYSGKQRAIMKYYQDMYDMFYDTSKPVKVYPVMVESKIYTGLTPEYDFKQNYSGTFDILHAMKSKDGKWRLIIHDFKTNGSIINEYARSTRQTLLPPFDDMIDEALSHYTLQLSLYSLGLMQLGYQIIDRALIWVKEDGSYEKVRVPDVTERLKSVMIKKQENPLL